MKKILFLFAIFAVFTSCKPEPEELTTPEEVYGMYEFTHGSEYYIMEVRAAKIGGPVPFSNTLIECRIYDETGELANPGSTFPIRINCYNPMGSPGMLNFYGSNNGINVNFDWSEDECWFDCYPKFRNVKNITKIK